MHNIIEARNLSLSYNKNEPIIKDTNLTVKKNDFVFLTGKSGSGKSTFLKSLYGELSVQSGELNVAGFTLHDINKQKKHFSENISV